MACFSGERKHLQFWYWVVPEKIHPAPKDENSAVRKRREEKFVSDNSKCIRTLVGDMGGGLRLISSVGEVWMFSGMTQ
jgi:hypothetical protein